MNERSARAVWCGTAVVASALAQTAEAAFAQTPRLAPPPPCRTDGRVPLAELGVSPKQAGDIVVAVLPPDARLTDGSQVHIPWALGRGVSRRLSSFVGITAPTSGTIERASAEAAGRTDRLAEMLGAKLVVTSSVFSQRGGAVLIVRILERDAEAPRWERQFSYPQSTLAAIEDQIVAAVVELLGARIPDGTRARVDSVVYDAVSRGDFFLRQHEPWSADSARAAYERARKASPRSADALGRLAYAYALSLERTGRLGPLGRADGLREADALVGRALRAGNTAAAWTARAVLERVRDPVNYGSAVRAHEQAVAVTPGTAEARYEFAVTLLRLGRNAAAEAQLKQALGIERDHAAALRLLAELEYMAKRYANACALINASIGADSYDPLAYALRARLRVRIDEFRDAFSDAETAGRLTGAGWAQALGFYVTALASDVDAARAEARQLTSAKLRGETTLGVYEAAYLAMGLAALGDRDKAFDALSRARPRGAELRGVLRDPGFDSIRSDRRFSRVAQESSPSPSRTGPGARAASSAH